MISHRFLDASTAKGMLGKKAPQRVGTQDLIGERNWGEILRSDWMKIALVSGWSKVALVKPREWSADILSA
jgi:hypothetical protein